MPLWGNQDNAANSTIFAASQVNKATTTANKTALFGNTTTGAFTTNQKVGQFGVSAGEATATPGITHSGWVLRTEGTGGRAGRVFNETLVAGGSMIGDASDDAVLPDFRISFATQPADSSANTNTAVSLSVSATSAPVTTLSYQWQKTYGGGAWTNVTNGGVFSGATTSTLAISNNATLNANTFRVAVTAGDQVAYSANAVITVL